MAYIAVAQTKAVMERNRFGQFISEIESASTRTVRKTIEQGARTSRGMAPAGKERWRYDNRPGYVPLKRSIRSRMVGKSKGYWYSHAPHAKYVEEGTAAHLIKGKLNFSWRGGFFVWDNPRFGPVESGAAGPHSTTSGSYKNWDSQGAWVFHPGTNAQPFLRPAFDRVVRRQTMEIAKREFPG